MRIILSLTLAPPKIKVKGLLGLSKTFENASSSFFTKNPAALVFKAIPLIELWALWQVPKASFT